MESKQENLEKIVAITTAIISVFLALSAVLGNKASGDSTMYLVRSNDQWAFYQAKSLKGHIYDVNRELLQTEITNPAYTPEYKAELKKKADEFSKNVERYDKEKSDIQKEAQNDEKLSAENNDKGDTYNYANGFYQISLILAAISLLARKRYMWVLSCILGIMGLGFSVYAFFMP